MKKFAKILAILRLIRRQVDCLTARQHKLFGPTGMMASLVIGMMLNIPVRSLEFLAAVPAMNGHAPL